MNSVCHAEANAFTFRCVASTQGCRLYTTLSPCKDCAKIIRQSRIIEVKYLDLLHKEESRIVTDYLFDEEKTSTGEIIRAKLPMKHYSFKDPILRKTWEKTRVNKDVQRLRKVLASIDAIKSSKSEEKSTQTDQ